MRALGTGLPFTMAAFCASAAMDVAPSSTAAATACKICFFME
jgi:hypothetical protein